VNRALWIVQGGLGVFFVGFGIAHFVVPEGLPEYAAWMYDMSTPLHLAAGTAEILGGLGLIVPAATRILPALTPIAAVGLIVVMLGAVVFHLGREEYVNVVGNVALAVVLAFVAWGRWSGEPIVAGRREG
jgi:uncharacterized membrane protein